MPTLPPARLLLRRALPLLLILPLLTTACTTDRSAAEAAKARHAELARQRAALEQLEVELARARDEDWKAVHRATTRVSEYVASRKKKAPRFAERMLSFSNQLDALLESNSDYRRHVGFVFDSVVLDPRKLEDEIDATISDFEADLASHDALLLVALGVDLPGEFSSRVPEELEIPARPGHLTMKVAQQVGGAATENVGGMVLGELAPHMIGSLAARTGSRTLSRLALAGAGLSGGASLGLGLLVEVMFSWFDDREEKIVADTEAGLDRLGEQLRRGHDGKPGLKGLLQAIAKDRQALRREVLTSSLGGPI